MYFPTAAFLLHLEYELNLYETYKTMITENIGIFCIYRSEQGVAYMISEKNPHLQYIDILFGWNKVHVANLLKKVLSKKNLLL